MILQISVFSLDPAPAFATGPFRYRTRKFSLYTTPTALRPKRRTAVETCSLSYALWQAMAAAAVGKRSDAIGEHRSAVKTPPQLAAKQGFLDFPDGVGQASTQLTVAR